MDGGYYESQLGFEAGAEYVTALGVSDLVTIKGCIRQQMISEANRCRHDLRRGYAETN